MEIKHSLVQGGDEYGKMKPVQGSGPKDIPISYIREEIRECLCNKIIAA